jgi:hypothetical protein
MKKKVKSKTRSHRGEKSPSSSKIFKIIVSFFQRIKYLLLAFFLILAAVFSWQLSQSWLVQTTFQQAKTYPKVSVLGTNIGGLNTDQLNNQLTRLKSEFETRKITLVNAKDKWVFSPSKLGVTFDAKATSQTVWQLNKLSLKDKYRLLTGDISSAVVPTIVVDSKVCVKSLSAISIPQVAPKDALIYFDNGLKIKPDQSGTKFNAISACRELFKQPATDLSVANVYLDVIPVNITKADLEPKLSGIRPMVGESISLESGTYKKTLTPEQLLGLLEISKDSSGVKVNWSSDKLDELVNSIANDIDTYNSSPALGTCQKLVSVGGNWLDKAATKKNIYRSRGGEFPIVYFASFLS